MSFVTMTTDQIVTNHVSLVSHSERLVLRALPTTCYTATYVPFPVPSVPLSGYYEVLPVLSELADGALHRSNLPGRHIDVSVEGYNFADVVSTESPGIAASQQSLNGTATETTSCCRSNCDLYLNDVSDMSAKVVRNCIEIVDNASPNSGNRVSITPEQVSSKFIVMMEKSAVGHVASKLTGNGTSSMRPYPLFCRTCRLRLNAPRQAREHFEGRAHARRLRLTGEYTIQCDKELPSNPQTDEVSTKRQMRIRSHVPCATGVSVITVMIVITGVRVITMFCVISAIINLISNLTLYI